MYVCMYVAFLGIFISNNATTLYPDSFNKNQQYVQEK